MRGNYLKTTKAPKKTTLSKPLKKTSQTTITGTAMKNKNKSFKTYTINTPQQTTNAITKRSTTRKKTL
jgi:hypothetical protein